MLYRRVGQTLEVLIDSVDGEGAVGRSYADAPEIDGNVFIDEAGDLKPGDMVKVTIDEAGDYDLWGQVEK